MRLDLLKKWVILKYNMTGLPSIRRIRIEQGHSLRTLADRVGMSYVALYRLESGVTDPRLGTLRKLAKALGVTVADLIGEGKPASK